ncbi:hypothetical protein F9L02_09995 [Brucella intermedia]|nr:hypothetical protein F9L02_09995 [Brucella intermedia]
MVTQSEIAALAACKWRCFALPVLMYLKVHFAPVLEPHHFRLALTTIYQSSCWLRRGSHRKWLPAACAVRLPLAFRFPS